MATEIYIYIYIYISLLLLHGLKGVLLPHGGTPPAQRGHQAPPSPSETHRALTVPIIRNKLPGKRRQRSRTRPPKGSLSLTLSVLRPLADLGNFEIFRILDLEAGCAFQLKVYLGCSHAGIAEPYSVRIEINCCAVVGSKQYCMLRG